MKVPHGKKVIGLASRFQLRRCFPVVVTHPGSVEGTVIISVICLLIYKAKMYMNCSAINKWNLYFFIMFGTLSFLQLSLEPSIVE